MEEFIWKQLVKNTLKIDARIDWKAMNNSGKLNVELNSGNARIEVMTIGGSQESIF